jgi:hypothetical protein
VKGIVFYAAYTVILLIVGSFLSSQMGASLERTAPNQPTSLDRIK